MLVQKPGTAKGLNVLLCSENGASLKLGALAG
jgi:hypothetical protein